MVEIIIETFSYFLVSFYYCGCVDKDSVKCPIHRKCIKYLIKDQCLISPTISNEGDLLERGSWGDLIEVGRGDLLRIGEPLVESRRPAGDLCESLGESLCEDL